jgi:tetratricopeptide (TPR) repeat protein
LHGCDTRGVRRHPIRDARRGTEFIAARDVESGMRPDEGFARATSGAEDPARGASSEDVRAAIGLGVAALAEDDLDEAVEILSLVTRCAPRHVDGHVALGIAHARRHELGKAIAVLEHAVELDPDNFLAHLRLSELYEEARRRPRSRDHLRAALVAARTAEERAVVERALSA